MDSPTIISARNADVRRLSIITDTFIQCRPIGHSNVCKIIQEYVENYLGEMGPFNRMPFRLITPLSVLHDTSKQPRKSARFFRNSVMW